MEQAIIILYYIIGIICILYGIYQCVNFFYFDKKAEKEINKFLKTKGIMYIILSVVSVVFTFVMNDSYKIIVMNTVYIAIFEAIQNLFQSYASDYKNDAEEMIAKAERSNLKEIESLDEFCRMKLKELEKNSSGASRQLICEEIKDYLKYYEDANDFLEALFNKENMGELYRLEEEFFQNFKYTCIKVVRLPR